MERNKAVSLSLKVLVYTLKQNVYSGETNPVTVSKEVTDTYLTCKMLSS